jgi:hypothetical protein
MSAAGQRLRRHRWPACIIVLIAAGACTTNGGTIVAGPAGSPVPLPSSDSSAPQRVTLETSGLSHNAKVESGFQDATIAVPYNSSFVLIGWAQDPEGLRTIEINGGTDSWTCVDPTTGTASTNNGLVSRIAQNTDTAAHPVQVYPERYVTASMSYMSCAPGEKLSAHAVFFARGINYSGLDSRSPTIVITYTKP